MATIKVKFRPSAVNGKAGAVCYQLCHRQENKQITTSMRIFPHWWNPQKRELITTPDNATTVSAYRRQIEQDVHKLREIVRQLDAAAQPYTLTDVVRLFQSDLASNGILEYLQKEILRLQDNNQYGTSRNYRRTLSSFSTFLKGTDVPLPAVDATLIGRYEKWLAQRNVRRNSSSFYMRILRAAYNKAVREKLTEQSYPFAQVYTGIAPTPKRAVSEETILQLQRLNLSGHPSLLLARDLFIFSYCTRGMAFVDMAYLKKSDIADGSITYYRHKTGQHLTLRIEPCIRIILERYLPARPDSPYIFPVITSADPEQAYRQYQTGLNYHNQKLKQLGALVSETLRLSSYTSRHSWATAARNHDIPLSVISAGMGHTSEKTTRIYLDSLNNTIIDDANRGILRDFNLTVSM